MRVLAQRDFDRFAALSHDDNPIHCDPGFARGTHFGATVAHGMFLYGLICGALTRKLDAPWLPVAQTLMFPAPTFAGDAVDVRLDVHEGPLVFDVGVTAQRDGRPTDTVIGQSRMRRVDEPAAPAALPQAVSMAANAGSAVPDRTATASLFGIEPGQRAKAIRRFHPSDLDEYADLCADANPLVIDTALARRCGLVARVVPGPLLAGMFSDLLGTKLPGRGTGWMKQSLHFLQPAYPGQPLHAMVEVVRVRPDKQLVNLRSTVHDVRGRLLVDGEALVLVRSLERAGE